MAVEYFIHALEKIPTLIETHEKKNAELSKEVPVLQGIKNTVWGKEDELKALKADVSALERKIELSLKPMDEGEDKPARKQERTAYNPYQNIAETAEQKAIREIDGLMSGKINPNNYSNGGKAYPVPERLKEYKDAMGDRPVIASIPKYEPERQSKGFKL